MKRFYKMENEDYQKSNRQKRLTPKSSNAFWCNSCDRDLVYEGGRCGTCGNVNGEKRLKKDT